MAADHISLNRKVSEMKFKSLALAALLSSTAVAAQADAIKLGYNGPPDAEKNAVHNKDC